MLQKRAEMHIVKVNMVFAVGFYIKRKSLPHVKKSSTFIPWSFQTAFRAFHLSSNHNPGGLACEMGGDTRRLP